MSVEWFGKWFVDDLGLAHASIAGDTLSYDYYLDDLQDQPGAQTIIEHMQEKAWMTDGEMQNFKAALEYARKSEAN